MDNISQCRECGSVFNKLKDYTTHLIKSHFNSQKVKKHKISRKAKKNPCKKIKTEGNQGTYCGECCKFYSTQASYKTHRYNYHTKRTLKNDKSTINPEDNANKDTNFNEFVRPLPSEMKADKLKCSICNITNLNYEMFVTIDKTHYHIQGLFPTLFPLIHDNIKKVICNKCLIQLYPTIDLKKIKNGDGSDLKLEEVSQNCNDNIPVKPETDLPVKELPVKKLPVKGFPVKELPETHNLILEQMEMKSPIQTFDCMICKTICDRHDHLEASRWLLPDRI